MQSKVQLFFIAAENGCFCYFYLCDGFGIQNLELLCHTDLGFKIWDQIKNQRPNTQGLQKLQSSATMLYNCILIFIFLLASKKLRVVYMFPLSHLSCTIRLRHGDGPKVGNGCDFPSNVLVYKSIFAPPYSPGGYKESVTVL